jgi:hypothetical protein
MILTVSIWVMRVLEVAFFAGITGCLLVVVISWVSIFAEGFKHGE